MKHQIDIEFDEYENCYVLSCPACSFRKHYYRDENRLDTINLGDVDVTHMGGFGGVQIKSVEVKQQDLFTDEEDVVITGHKHEWTEPYIDEDNLKPFEDFLKDK